MNTFTEQTRTLIVGGTSGIGKAVADALSERPGKVVAVSRATGLDVSDAKAVCAYVRENGPFDHLVFTAGSAAPGGAVTDVDLQAARAAFDTKFWGGINVVRAVAQKMPAGGTITLTSGFLARRTVPGTFVKTAMNAAIEASAKILAKELAPIRVNVVSPGLTDTEAYAGMPEEARKAMLEATAAKLPVAGSVEPGTLPGATCWPSTPPS
ncbi:SDR family oxidoreductase [Profundibacter sp.]|uniref:SDR family oxidoreductase n=1 Tax=Profundibacter sp. TaxID=3101071 RepID=UPI003D0AD572